VPGRSEDSDLVEPQSSSAVAERIGQQTRRGISWNLAGAVATNGMRVIVLAVLGRALSSSDFGIVAAAVSVNTIVYSIRDIGVGPALIQRDQIDNAHLTTAFAVSMYMGFALSGILVLAAPLIGETFHITGSVNVIRALALLLLVRNTAVTSRMMCRREMNFRLIAVIDTTSFMAGSVVSLVAVAVYGGPWALVAGYWVEEVIATALYFVYQPPKFSFAIHLRQLRELLSFGIGQTITAITMVIATYGDNVIVGHVLGTTALGYYSRAYDLIRFPSMVFEAVVGSVLFSAFSRLQRADRDGLASNFRRVMFVNGLLLLPASAALIVLAPEAVRLLIGPGWDEAVLPFRILTLAIVMRTNQKLGAVVAQAAGAVNAVAISFTIYAIAVVGGAAIAIRWGIPGVACSTALANTILCIECCFLAMRVSGLGLRSVLGAHVPGLALSALVVVIGWPLASVLRSIAPAAVTFSVVAAAAIVSCITAVVIWLKLARGDFAWLGTELRRLRRVR